MDRNSTIIAYVDFVSLASKYFGDIMNMMIKVIDRGAPVNAQDYIGDTVT